MVSLSYLPLQGGKYRDPIEIWGFPIIKGTILGVPIIRTVKHYENSGVRIMRVPLIKI